MPDEMSAQFDLLKLEMTSIQAGVRGIDAILFQVKGWCVTICVASAGLALTTKTIGLLAVGTGAALGFWLVDAHYKSVQRVFIERDAVIETALAGKDPIAVLRDGGLIVPGLGSAFRTDDSFTFGQKVRLEVRRLWREARLPLTFGVYLVILVLLGTLAVVATVS